MANDYTDKAWMEKALKGFSQQMDSWVLGENIRKQRMKKDMTLQELADKAGTSKGYLWEIETRHKNPSVFLVFRIAHALDISVDYLICSRSGIAFCSSC